MGHLLDALERGYRVLGFAAATGGDEVFAQLVAARIIEPTSKLDSLRVLEDAGADAASFRTVTRRLRGYAKQGWREKLSAARAAHAGRAQGLTPLWAATADQRAGPGCRGRAGLPAARRHRGAAGPLERPGTGR
jgi:hypothetical protein